MTERNSRQNNINYIKIISDIISKGTKTSDLDIFNQIEKLRLKTSNSDVFNSHPSKKSAAQLIKKDSTPPKWGQFLYKIIKSCNFTSCLELGTCLGFSSAYMAAALHPKGKVISIEGLKDRANIARKNLKSLALNNFEIIAGQFFEVLPNILKDNKFDFVYIDGHHKENATLKYFNIIYPSLCENSIVIIDDVHWPQEMKPAWKKIKKDSRISQTLTINKWGICIIKKPE